VSKVRLYGATSGYVDVQAPDVAGDVTVTLPNGDIATEAYADAAASSATAGLATEAYADSAASSATTGLAAETYVDSAVSQLENYPAFSTTFLGVNFSPSTSYTKISCFNTSPSVNRGGFSVSTSAVTVPENGLYFVSWNVRLTGDGNIRSNTGVSIGVNNSATQSIYAAHSYIRDDSGHDETSSNASGILSLSSGDTLHIYGRREGAVSNQSSTANVGSFNVYKIGNAI